MLSLGAIRDDREESLVRPVRGELIEGDVMSSSKGWEAVDAALRGGELVVVEGREGGDDAS
jgi:hypothetical protein